MDEPIQGDEIIRANVEVTSFAHSSRSYLPYQGVQLGFAAVDARELRRGVRELAAVLGA